MQSLLRILLPQVYDEADNAMMVVSKRGIGRAGELLALGKRLQSKPN